VTTKTTLGLNGKILVSAGMDCPIAENLALIAITICRRQTAFAEELNTLVYKRQ
jgi:hypothetical protein